MTQLTTKRSPRLTPRALLEAPRRSHPIPNTSGDLAVYTQHIYSFQRRRETREICVVDTQNGRTWPVTTSTNASFPRWLGHSDQLIWLGSTENGHTNLIVGSARLRGGTYVAGTIPGPVRDLRVAGVLPDDEEDDDLSFIVIGKSNPDGTLFNPVDGESARAQLGKGRLYHGIPRVDRPDDPDDPDDLQNVIWFGCLTRPSGTPDGRYTMSGITNLMSYFGLGTVTLQDPENIQEVCQDVFMTSWMIIFSAKDLELQASTHTACSWYYCPMMTWNGYPLPDDFYKAIRHRGLGGSISSLTANANGAVAFLAQKRDGYAADKNRIFIVSNVQTGEPREIFASEDCKGQWDLSPSAVSFASDRSLLIQVAEQGQRVLYQLNLNTWPAEPTPSDLRKVSGLLSTSGSIMNVTPLAKKSTNLLASCERFTHDREFLVIDTATGPLQSLSHDIPRFGLSPDQLDHIWFPGADDHPIHAWVIKPSDFDPQKTYPVAYILHDSPHDSWSGQWSTWVNLALFAEHGYVVVAPDISGSIGYGQDFTDRIKGSWGGLPYLDLQRGFEYMEEHIPYVNTNRAVAVGSGYGGYLVNWIQGQELGRKFRALVTDNGILSIMSYLSSDMKCTPFYEMNGSPWENPEEWDKWDPTLNLDKWSTPHLIICRAQGGDYPASDALAAFHTLQLRGVQCSLLHLPLERSEVEKQENMLLWYESVLDWMDRYTR